MNELFSLLKTYLWETFKDNTALEKLIVTGIFTLAKAGIFTRT